MRSWPLAPTCHNETADLSQQQLPALDWLPSYCRVHAAAELPEPAVDEDVEGDEEDEGNKAIEEEVHIDNIDQDIVTVLSEKCGNHYRDLDLENGEHNKKDLAMNTMKVTSCMVEFRLVLVVLVEGKTLSSVVSSMNLGIL